LLAVSFRSSGHIKHNVTKGTSREHQVLDTLEKLLPTSVAVERSAIIVDSQDTQTSKFDGALVDRANWPRLFCDDSSTAVVMESVVVALEIKSELNSEEIRDIFSKSASLRKMIHPSAGRQPRVAGFSYSCSNMTLSFVDFNLRHREHGIHSPSAICVLGEGVFTFARFTPNGIALTDEHSDRNLPIYFPAGPDSLLLFLYLLSRWITANPTNMGLFSRYMTTAFKSATAFSFDTDFLDVIQIDQAARETARDCFKGQGALRIQDVYAKARAAVGLKPRAV
jgi:hypothetical protein